MFLLATIALPAFALSPDSSRASSPTGEVPAPSNAELAELEREQREHAEWLSSPEAQRQREASRGAYGQLSPGQAQGLLFEAFPHQLDALNADPARVLSRFEVEKILGTHEARIATEDGKSAILESSSPVASDLGGNGEEPVDLTLERSGSGFVPRNPLTEVRLPGSAEEPIELQGEIGVELPASGNRGAEPLGAMNLFYPETETATDTLVSPRAGGVEVFEQLRSPQSPERFSFAFDLPAGATLRTSKDGGAEVVSSSGKVLDEVPPPTAVDAQGASVPVTTSVEGNSLVLDVSHRSREVAYPLLVDPNNQVEDTTSFGEWTSSESSKFEYYLDDNVSSLDAISKGEYYYYPPETHGQWDYTAYGENAYISEATFSPVYFIVHNCETNQPHGYIGLYNSTSKAYNALHVFSTEYFEGSYETNEAGSYNTRDAIIGIGTGLSGVELACRHELYVGGYTITEKDPYPPTINSVSGVPSGWFDPAKAGKATVGVTDTGLGVHEISIEESGGGSVHDQALSCSGANGSRCPREASWEASPPYKDGERTLEVTAEDPVENVAEWSPITTKVDSTKPAIDLGGQLAYVTEEEGVEGEENEASENKLSLPVYGLHIDAIDGSNESAQTKQSGVEKIEVLLDGSLVEEEEAPPCPESSCELEVGYQLQLTGLSEGVHKLKVVATDRVGLAGEREIEFEYVPATGIKGEYVLQRFPLPDGEEGEESEESHGPELAVNVTNGNLVYHERDIELSAPSTNLEIERFYNSQLPEEDSSEWGKGWTLSQIPRLAAEGEGEGQPAQTARTLSARSVVSRAVKLPTEDEEERFDPQLHATVTKVAGGGYELTDENEETTAFNSAGQPSEVRTGTYSKLAYEYEGERLSEIAVEDPAASETPPEEVSEEEGAEGQPTYQATIGSGGTEDGRLSGPRGMAIDSGGHIWVADAGNDRVQEFGSEGEYLGQFGTEGTGNGRLQGPSAPAIDSGGHIWVADAGNDRVQEFGSEGEYLGQFGTEGTEGGQFSAPGPQGVAIDSGGDILVTDSGGGRVERFDEEGEYLESLGASQLSEPTGIAMDSGGHIWVADGAADKVVEFDGAGEEIRQFGTEGEEEGQLSHPTALAVDGEGRVWVCDTGNGRVQEFGEKGEFLHEFGSEGSVKGRFEEPKGVLADSEGDVWVAGVSNLLDESPPEEPQPREGLVAAYSFNEGSGETAYDSAGSHDGTLHGAEWTEAGKYGGALHFNPAESARLTIPNSAEFDFKEGFTLEAWVRPDEERKESPIFAKIGSGGAFSYNLYAHTGAGVPKAELSDGEGGWKGIEGTKALPVEAWSYVALASDGEHMHLYVDGELVETATSLVPQVTEGELRIGGNEKWGEYFKGAIDNVRIYDTMLGEAEVGEDGEAEVPKASGGSSPKPVAAYSFNEGSGETAYDSAGSHDGTLHGAEWTEAGKYGGALHFSPAESARLTIPNSEEFDFKEGFTLEAWVRPDEERKESPIFAKIGSGGAFSYNLYAHTSAGVPKAELSDGEGGWKGIEGTKALPVEAWSYVALASDGEHMHLYVDGELVETATSLVPQVTEGELRIGGNEKWGEYFKGTIDNVRVYDTMLGEAEVGEDGEAPIVLPGSEAPEYAIQRWKVVDSEPITPPVDDPSLQVGYEGGLVSSVKGDQIASQSYEHEGELLTAHAGSEGKAEYGYDSAERLTEVRLPNGTTATIEYEEAYGRVTAVTVDPAGEEPAKTTHFKYSDEPRETMVTPESEQATHYAIGADGSVLKWWNAEVPPEIEELTGSLYDERGEVHPEPISSGGQTLLVKAHSEEGIASIQIVANGSDLVTEKTCELEETSECTTLEKELVTETENWSPGVLQLEVIVTDRLEQVSSERFWDNIPYTPPPEPEALEPPKFEEILKFREEYGLDLDLKGNEQALNERVFELINAWHHSNIYLGEVARASWERWGVPMRPVDVAEMEYREWFYNIDSERIDQWVEETEPSSYAGYYIDQAAGGIMHIGFTSNQTEQLASLEASLSLVAAERLQVYPTTPTVSYLSVQETSQSVPSAIESNATLRELVVDVEEDEAGKAVRVGTPNVAQVESILHEMLGPNAPVAVEYDTGSGSLLGGRFRNEGRMRAGDYINSDPYYLEGIPTGGPCTAGFGATDRGYKPNGEPVLRLFLLTAGHCAANVGEEVWRNKYDGNFEFPFADAGKSEVGRIARTTFNYDEYGGVRTDGAAIRITQGDIVPRAIWGWGGHALPTKPAGRARKGNTVCYSGAISNNIACGRIVARSLNWHPDGAPFGLAGYWVRFPKDKRPQHGDSGSPVWNPRTGASIGLVSAGRPEDLSETLVAPLLHPPNMPAYRVPGILHHDHMEPLQLKLGG